MSEEAKPEKKLTAHEKRFVEEYIKCANGAEAARRAGYSEKNARGIASENLTKPHIRAAIESYWQENHMTTAEAVQRLSDMARGDIGDFLDERNEFDLSDAKERGLTKLIKKFRQRTTIRRGNAKNGTDDEKVIDIELELHDPQAAIEKIMRVSGDIKTDVVINVNLTDD